MGRKPVRKPQNNPDNGELSNNRTIRDFLDTGSNSEYPGKDQWRQRLINTMLTWGSRASSIDTGQFLLEYKIPKRTMYDWIERYPDVRMAWEDMKSFIGTHRRVGVITRKLDGAYAYKDMHLYDSDWLAVNKYHAELKKEDDQKNVTINVTMPKPEVITKEEMKGIKDESV